MTDDTLRVEIFQPRDSREVPDEDYQDFRAVSGGFLDEVEITHDNFARLYEFVGTDRIPTDTDDPLDTVFNQWNNGSGVESDAFRYANSAERAVSLYTGCIVRLNGTAYLCGRGGEWTELPTLSY